MQAVEVDISNPVSGFARTATTDAAGRFVFSNLPPNPYHLAVSAQGFQALDQDVDVRSARADHAGPGAGAGRRDDDGRVVGHAEDLLERDPTAHTDIDQSLMAKLPIETSWRAEPGGHAGVARRRRRLERVLPSDRRSRADAVLDRQPADHRPAEPHLFESDFAGCRAVDGSDHRRRAGRVRRQEQPGRPHRHEVGPRSAEADRQRSRSATGRSGARRSTSTSAPDRTRSATSCRSPACGPIATSIRRSSRRCTTRAQPVVVRPARLRARATLDTLRLNVQVAQSSFDVPNTYDQDAIGQASAPDDRHVQRRAGLHAGAGVEAAAHRERFVRQDRVDVRAQRGSVRRHAGDGIQNRHLTTSEAKWTSRTRGVPQPEVRRIGQPNRAARRTSRTGLPTGPSTRRARTRTGR